MSCFYLFWRSQMQERYLGDWHDLVKYALLRFLGDALELRIGVNWYLTCPEELGENDRKDGEKRHHLNSKEWEELDSDLFKRICHFNDPAKRRLASIKEAEILPWDTLYFEEPVPCSKEEERHAWHQRARLALADADLIFLDPDNGFEVKSMKPRKKPKYAFFKEAADFFLMDKVVVGIQFARQRDPIKWGIKQKERLHAESGEQDMLPIIRGRVSPNILFLTLSPPELVKQVKKALCDFADCSPKFDGNKKRVEII